MQKEFQMSIQGISLFEDCERYASLMIHRLMFLYFIQRQGLLGTPKPGEIAGDPHYLRNRLGMAREQYTFSPPSSFYLSFLRRLFYEGLSQYTPAPDLEDLLGGVSILNASLFNWHILEEKYPELQIPDQAFEHLFAFFDEFDWHLDDRPPHSNKEINLHVLGYIFEKCANQRQMGAYYTQEDITEYISKTTIIPYILNEAEKKCPATFQATGIFWSLLRARPDDYMYEMLKKGCMLPLPAEIEIGIQHVGKREEWNRAAPLQYAWPAETWREVIARRQRYAEVRTALEGERMLTINDLIAYNLNLGELVCDTFASNQRADELAAFYDILTSITILDPTCGSGAFLFAALKVLTPLYKVCLRQMRSIVARSDSQTKGETAPQLNQPQLKPFRHILRQIACHPGEDYFIGKSILLHNLYGIDIVEEAAEMCKLRLLLKLVSQVKTFTETEPLPDLDLHIRVGNALVGLATLADIRRIEERQQNEIGRKRPLLASAQREPEYWRSLDDRELETGEITRNFLRFRQCQMQREWDRYNLNAMKQELCLNIERGCALLDPMLAAEYEITPEHISAGDLPHRRGADQQQAGFVESLDARQRHRYKEAIAQWKKSHQPFHWYLEFAWIMHQGGFAVTIGNPPYVEYESVRKYYQILHYVTLSCGNLYAFIVERCTLLLTQTGRLGMIVPTSASCTDGYIPLQKLLLQQSTLYISSYSEQRGRLFDIPHPRLCIILYQKQGGQSRVYSTGYMKLERLLRDRLFERLEYTEITELVRPGIIPRYGSSIEKSIHRKLHQQRASIRNLLSKSGNFRIYFTRKLSWFVQIIPFMPFIIDAEGKKREPSEMKHLTFSSQELADIVFAILNSNLFYWFIMAGSDCRNLNMREVLGLPVDIHETPAPFGAELCQLATRLADSLQSHAEKRAMDFKGRGMLTIECFFPARSKSIIDEIDFLLAKHYDFTDKELDFLINYDIKYRLGRDGNN